MPTKAVYRINPNHCVMGENNRLASANHYSKPESFFQVLRPGIWPKCSCSCGKYGIYLYETEGTGKNCTQRVVIYYKFVGYPDLPGEAQTFTEDTRQGVAVEYVSCEPQEDILEVDA